MVVPNVCPKLTCYFVEQLHVNRNTIFSNYFVKIKKLLVHFPSGGYRAFFWTQGEGQNRPFALGCNLSPLCGFPD